jgi:uncharacterized membrane protein YeiH
MTEPPLLLAFDLAGTFVFAVDGAITGLEAARLDIVGMVTLGIVTALGGGVVRDVLIGAVPPSTFRYWPYLAVAAGGALLAFFFSRVLRRFTLPIDFLDAAGLSLFCVTGATKSLEYGLGAAPAVILGAVTGVGGGTIRDVLVRRVPTVLTSGLVCHTRPGRGCDCRYRRPHRHLRRPSRPGSRPGLFPDPGGGYPVQPQRPGRTRG